MNPLIISTLLGLIGRFVPAIANNAALINDVISSISQVAPFIVKEYGDVVPLIRNIINAVKGTDGITQEQWDELDALEKQIDAEFDAAAKDEGFGDDPNTQPQ